MRIPPHWPRRFALDVHVTGTLCVAGMLGVAGMLAVGPGCAAPSARTGARRDDPAAAGARADAASPAHAAQIVARRPGRTQLAEGLVLERVGLRRLADAGSSIDPATSESLLTLLRIDPRRWDLRLLTAAGDGGARTAPEWARAFGLAAVTNAALYLPDQRSIGLMVDGDAIHNPRDNQRLAGFLAFHPRRGELPPVRIFGRDCPGFTLDEVRASYATVIQNYRMLDCERRAVPWKDEKQYAIAGVGTDTSGWVVFLHCSTPMRVHQLNQRLADAELGLVSAVFVEGGRQASLVVQVEAGRVEEAGSAAGAGALAGLSRAFWPIPNVLGVVPRGEGLAPSAPRQG